MMSDPQVAIYTKHREAQDKYTYFLLAVAASAVALSIKRTTGQALTWSMVPLGFAVLSWGISFFCGTLNLRYVVANLYANFNLLEVEAGHHPEVPPHPAMIAAATQGIRSAMADNDTAANRHSRRQFWYLVAGAIFFIFWHILDMASLTVPEVAGGIAGAT